MVLNGLGGREGHVVGAFERQLAMGARLEANAQALLQVHLEREGGTRLVGNLHSGAFLIERVTLRLEAFNGLDAQRSVGLPGLQEGQIVSRRGLPDGALGDVVKRTLPHVLQYGGIGAHRPRRIGAVIVHDVVFDKVGNRINGGSMVVVEARFENGVGALPVCPVEVLGSHFGSQLWIARNQLPRFSLAVFPLRHLEPTGEDVVLRKLRPSHRSLEPLGMRAHQVAVDDLVTLRSKGISLGKHAHAISTIGHRVVLIGIFHILGVQGHGAAGETVGQRGEQRAGAISVGAPSHELVASAHRRGSRRMVDQRAGFTLKGDRLGAAAERTADGVQHDRGGRGFPRCRVCNAIGTHHQANASREEASRALIGPPEELVAKAARRLGEPVRAALIGLERLGRSAVAKDPAVGVERRFGCLLGEVARVERGRLVPVVGGTGTLTIAAVLIPAVEVVGHAVFAHMLLGLIGGTVHGNERLIVGLEVIAGKRDSRIARAMQHSVGEQARRRGHLVRNREQVGGLDMHLHIDAHGRGRLQRIAVVIAARGLAVDANDLVGVSRDVAVLYLGAILVEATVVVGS